MTYHRPDKSVKGYYYNLDISPHVWKSPCGDSYKLPSAKRVELMEKRVQESLKRLDKLLQTHNLADVLPPEMVTMLKRYIIQGVYEGIIGR